MAQFLPRAPRLSSSPAVQDAHRLLKRAADRWCRGNSEEPLRENVLRELLDRLLRGPLRVPCWAINSLWLAWDGGVLLKLARAFDDDPASDRLLVLADALEDAGCTDAELLAHCRGSEPHLLGCWLVDLLLAKTTSPMSLLRQPRIAGERHGNQQARAVSPGEDVLRFGLAVEDAHAILHKATTEWVEGNPEDPTTAGVLTEILQIFGDAKFLRLP
jgi:hypothetical protein